MIKPKDSDFVNKLDRKQSNKKERNSTKKLISKALEGLATKMIKNSEHNDKLKELGIKNNFKLK
jgi:hypothetical protein